MLVSEWGLFCMPICFFMLLYYFASSSPFPLGVDISNCLRAYDFITLASFICLFITWLATCHRYGNKRIESSAQRPFPPSFRVVHQQPVYDKNPQSSRVLLSCEHNTRENTVQAQVPLDRSTEGAAILCSSSVREDAGTSSSSPRKDSLTHPSYGFIPVPIPVGAAIPYHYGAIMQPMYYPQGAFMHCDSAAINKTAIQHASCQSNYHENLGKPPQIDEHKQPEENHQLHHSRQILRESGEPVDLAKAHMERINQSASCSQDIRKGSGCTGSGETDANTNTVIALESGNESGVQNCSNNVLDGDRSRREAALLKFRMKRKDRCFEKKVLCLTNLYLVFLHIRLSIYHILCTNMPTIL